MTDTNLYSDPRYSPQQYQPTPSSSNIDDTSGISTRQETSPRKRPKYTRSKTGCMTCRIKKIKCDETKPVCMRCTHGSRECIWPENVPARKRSVGKSDDKTSPSEIMQDSSPTMPESPTLSAREDSPPRRNLSDFSLMTPLPSRPNDAFADLYPNSISRDFCPPRTSTSERPSIYPQHHSHLSSSPENHYSAMRYDHTLGHDAQTARGIQAPRPVYSQQGTYWNHEPVEHYYHEHQPSYQFRPTGSNDYPQDKYLGQ